MQLLIFINIYVIMFNNKGLTHFELIRLASEKAENAGNPKSNLKNFIYYKADRNRRYLNHSYNSSKSGDKENYISCFLKNHLNQKKLQATHLRNEISNQKNVFDQSIKISTPFKQLSFNTYEKQVEQQRSKHKLRYSSHRNDLASPINVQKDNLSQQIYQQEIKMMRDYSDYVKEQNKMYIDIIHSLRRDNQELKGYVGKYTSFDFEKISLVTSKQQQCKAFTANTLQIGILTDECYRYKELQIKISMLEKDKTDLSKSKDDLQQMQAQNMIQRQIINRLQMQKQLESKSTQTDGCLISEQAGQTQLSSSDISSLEAEKDRLSHSIDSLMTFCNTLCFDDEKIITFLPEHHINDIWCQCLNSKLSVHARPLENEISLLKQINQNLKMQFDEKQLMYTALLKQAHKTINNLVGEMRSFQILATTNYSNYLSNERSACGIKTLFYIQ